MKKPIALLLAAVMLLCLTACGGDQTLSSSQPPVSENTDAVTVEEPQTIAEQETAGPESFVEESAVEEPVQEPAEPLVSDDDVVLGENTVAAGDTIALSVDTDGLSPLFGSFTDTTLSSAGNVGKNTYCAAAYVTDSGIQDSSNPEMAEEGSITETEAEGVVIRDDHSGSNGLIINNVPYSIRGADIVLESIDNGLNTSDFAGKGAAVMATGAGANVTLEDSNIDVTGVARLAAFADNGATLTVRNSTLTSRGGTLYAAYRNTATISSMVSPPWVLGIMGTSRCTNLMGQNSTLNLVDSSAATGAWAGLSTDSGTNLHLNVFNSEYTLLNQDESEIPFQAQGGQLENLDNPFTTRYGSGYAAFTIGAAVETFRGSTFHVGTMANIFTGGFATYGALKAGQTYTLESGSGETDIEYTAEEDRNTVIESDTFAFMVHQNSNTLNVIEGTEVNSAYTGILVKTGSSGASMDATFEDSDFHAGNGVLVQLMDNDDALLGGMDSSGGFYETFTETAGFPTAPAASDGTLASETEDMGPGSVPSTGAETSSFTFRNMELEGNLYNAGGWYGGLVGIPMNVVLEDTTLSGAIATTTVIHVTYDGAVAYAERKGVAFDDDNEASEFADKYQATEYSVSEYWTMGQVANKIAYSGSNVINVTLSGDSVWNVESTSMINSLTLEDGAKVVVPKGVTLSVNGEEFTDCTIDQADVYGVVAEPGEASASGGMFNFPGGMPPGPPPGGFPGWGGAEEDTEKEPVFTYVWSLADTDLAELTDNGDGTVNITGTAAGTVCVYVDVVIDGVSAGRFTKIIDVT